MGNYCSFNQEVGKLRIEEWKQVENGQIYNVWQNKLNRNWHIEQYPIENNARTNIDQQNYIYGVRNKNLYVVQSYPMLYDNDDYQCCASSKRAIFTERISLRLDQMQHIPWPDYLHLYDRTFKGYRDISKNFGHFQVDDSMVGVNQKHEIKVWLNQNFSKIDVSTARTSEQHMIKTILQALQRSLDQNTQLPRLNQYILQNSHGLQFNNVINAIQNYSWAYNKGNIPSKLNCIKDVGGLQSIINSLILSSSKVPTYSKYNVNTVNNSQNNISKYQSTFNSRDNSYIVNKPVDNYHQENYRQIKNQNAPALSYNNSLAKQNSLKNFPVQNQPQTIVRNETRYIDNSSLINNFQRNIVQQQFRPYNIASNSNFQGNNIQNQPLVVNRQYQENYNNGGNFQAQNYQNTSYHEVNSSLRNPQVHSIQPINADYSNQHSNARRTSANSPMFVVQVTPGPTQINQNNSRQASNKTFSFNKNASKVKSNKKRKTNNDIKQAKNSIVQQDENNQIQNNNVQTLYYNPNYRQK